MSGGQPQKHFDMKKTTRIIIGSILTACGLGIAGFSGYLLFQGADLSVMVLIGGLLLGILLALGGIAVTRGESIRDIIEIFLLGS